MGAPIDRDAVWVASLEVKNYTAKELARLAGIRIDRVRESIRSWLAAGRIKISPTKRDGCTVYSRTGRKGGLARPETERRQLQLWRTARMMREFTAATLALHAATPGLAVTDEQARAACRIWLKASYLKVTQKARPGHNSASYMLVNDTGPEPPVERRVRAVYDPNMREYTHIAEPAR